VIIGSGPAGCATAIKLHRMAPDLTSRILVIEALRHPREKVCAGGINGQAWRQLDSLGIKVDVDRVEIDRAVVKTAVGDIVLEAPGVSAIVRRADFDAAIAAHLPEMGIELCEGVRLENAKREGLGIRLETTAGPIFARAIVGADGAYSVVRRCMFHQEDITYLLAMAECPAKGHYTHSEKTLTIDSLRADEGVPGYRWTFPFMNEGEEWVNVGIAEWIYRGANELKRQLIKYMDKLDLDSGNARFRFFPERPFHPRNPFCAPGVLLAGEAAGIDPFLGEGVSYGIRYGILAAETIVDALRNNDFSFKWHMSSLKWSRLGKELMACLAANRLFYGKLHRLMVQMIGMDKEVARLLGEVLAGRLEPTERLAAKIVVTAVRNLITRVLPF